MSGEDEHRVVIRRLVAPPPFPRFISPRPWAAPEHVSSHDRSADAAEDLLGDLGARVDLATFLAVLLAEGLQRHEPLVQCLSADPERTLRALTRPGDVAVERNRDRRLDCAHLLSRR